jgi:hypothetical protein
MLKVAWLVRLTQQGDHDDLLGQWNGEHAELVRSVPGLEKYVHNQTLAIAEGPGAGTEAPVIDGVACAWWADDAAFDAGVRSSEWRKVLDHGQTIFDLEWPHAYQAVAIEERVMRVGAGTPWSGSNVPAAMCKHVGVLHFRPDLTRDEARAWWTERHGALALDIEEIRYYVQNHAVRPIRLDGAEVDGQFPFDGFSESWFTDRPTFEHAHESPAWLRLRDDSPNVFDVAALESGVNCVVAERVIKG